MTNKIALSWSGGKDSTLALRKLLYEGEYKVEVLLTLFNPETQMVPYQYIPIDFIRKQAESLNIPLLEIPVGSPLSNLSYENVLTQTFQQLKKQDIHTVAYGDINSQGIRNYREQLAAKIQVKFIYPLWDMNIAYLANDFIERGFKAIISSLDTLMLDENFLGEAYDSSFIANLPDTVDICGEHGEFHTFVYDGPIFSKAISFETGEIYDDGMQTELVQMKYIEILQASAFEKL